MPTATKKNSANKTSSSRKSTQTSTTRKPGLDRRGLPAPYNKVRGLHPDDIDVDAYRAARKKEYTKGDMGLGIVLAVSLTLNVVFVVSWLYWR